MERLAAAAARSLGCTGGLEAAETVIRAGMLKLGGGMLEKLLAADPGYRGPRTRCGCGQLAEFVAYRDKTFDTVLDRVTICRAWYHPTTRMTGTWTGCVSLDTTTSSTGPERSAATSPPSVAR